MKYHFMPALALIFLLSCTKENNKSTPEPAIDPIPQFSVSAAKFIYSSKLLRREVSYIKTNPLLKYVRLFTYDGANRCTEIKLGTIDSSKSNPIFNLTQTLTFSYGGSNSLLPSSLASVRTVFPNLVTNFYYKYNSQGRKITDSVRVKNQAGDPADRTVPVLVSTHADPSTTVSSLTLGTNAIRTWVGSVGSDWTWSKT